MCVDRWMDVYIVGLELNIWMNKCYHFLGYEFRCLIYKLDMTLQTHFCTSAHKRLQWVGVYDVNTLLEFKHTRLCLPYVKLMFGYVVY